MKSVLDEAYIATEHRRGRNRTFGAGHYFYTQFAFMAGRRVGFERDVNDNSRNSALQASSGHLLIVSMNFHLVQEAAVGTSPLERQLCTFYGHSTYFI